MFMTGTHKFSLNIFKIAPPVPKLQSRVNCAIFWNIVYRHKIALLTQVSKKFIMATSLIRRQHQNMHDIIAWWLLQLQCISNKSMKISVNVRLEIHVNTRHEKDLTSNRPIYATMQKVNTEYPVVQISRTKVQTAYQLLTSYYFVLSAFSI